MRQEIKKGVNELVVLIQTENKQRIYHLGWTSGLLPVLDLTLV